jgi:hypothetical protein
LLIVRNVKIFGPVNAAAIQVGPKGTLPHGPRFPSGPP